MRKLLILGALLASTPSLAATNLITNGGFESGNTGFTSTYTYVAPGGSMIPENTYSVGANASAYHPSWANVPAFAGTNYLIANGSSTPNAAVWRQTVGGLIVGRTYNFSGYATNVCCNASFNGTNVTPIIIAVGTGGNPAQLTTAAEGTAGTTGQWRNITGSFQATAGSTQLSIFTDTNAASGNDYGLDNLSLTLAAVPEPTSWAMMIGGFGAVGFASRRRRRMKSVTA